MKCTLSGTPIPLGLCWRRENAVRNRQHVVVEALLSRSDPCQRLPACIAREVEHVLTQDVHSKAAGADRVARHRGLDPADIENLHFHFADPDACLLGTARPNGPIVPTPLFEALRASALKIRPTLSRWTASRPPLVGIRTTAFMPGHSSACFARWRARPIVLCCCWITRAHRA